MRVALPLAAIAGIGHWQLGLVDMALLGNLLIRFFAGDLPGQPCGSEDS